MQKLFTYKGFRVYILYLPWCFLVLALILIGYNKQLAYGSLLIAIIAAFYSNIVSPMSIGILVLVSVILFGYQKRKMFFVEILIVLFCVLLTLHYIPGFNNWKVLDKVFVSENSAPFTMYFNFDKALIPLILVWIMPTLFVSQNNIRVSISKWLYLCTLPILLLMCANFFGILKFEYHVPQWIFFFLVANIFFVALAEEALFRGYLQQRLSLRFGNTIAIIVSAILFGIIHFKGGILLIIFASLAGIIYGLAWAWSGRLWVSAFFHFGLNLLHLLFFTYPSYFPQA